MIDTFSSGLPKPASDAGYTLVELLVASTIAVVVFGAIISLLASSQRVQARDTEWARVIQEGRVGLVQMTHEMRQASKIEPAEAKAESVVFYATIAGKAWEIKYDCGVSQSGTTYSECVRFAVENAAETPKSLPSTGTPIVRDLVTGTAVFAYFKGTESNTTEPDVVTMKLELPAAGTLKQANSRGNTHVVVLENAAFMRNLIPAG